MVEWQQRIRDVLVSFADVHLALNAVKRKLANARAACRVPEDDFVIGLIDRTLFGSAKQAVLFATRNIYVRDRWTEGCPGGVLVIDYHDLPHLERMPGLSRALIPDVVRGPFDALCKMVDALGVAHLETAPVPHAAGDVGGTPEAVALQDAIAATPDDDGPQLVLADLLIAADDPRGELIVLHQREITEGLTEPAALERYLLLGAVYSFPRALPEPPLLPFIRLSARPVLCTVTHDDVEYALRYGNGSLEITPRGRPMIRRRLKLGDRHTLTTAEAAIILRHVSDALRAGSPLQNLQLPFGPDPLPSYGGGPVRSYRLPEEFTRPRGLRKNELGLAARDYHHWIACWRRLSRALHPSSSSFADVV